MAGISSRAATQPPQVFAYAKPVATQRKLPTAVVESAVTIASGELAVNTISDQRTLDARAAGAWTLRFARTTPGVVSVVAVIIAATCLIAGAVCAVELNSRIAARAAVLDRSEPLAYAAQNLYAALSAADTAAATGFLATGETGPARARYQQAMADAAGALADLSAGATRAETRQAVGDATAQLAAYAGLVESARANNRQGYPIGSAYLREASSLMQGTLLPEAKKIFTGDLATVDDDQRAVGTVPVAGFVLLGVTLVAIGIGSVLMRARTNRVFNVGLVIAAVAVLLTAGWMVVVTRVAASHIEQSRSAEADRFGRLAKARIVAEQARTVETLQLIARGDPAAGEKSFFGLIDELENLLNGGPQTAQDGVAQWVTGHRDQIRVYLNGEYPAALARALGTEPGTSAASFAVVESSLRDEIEKSRATMREHVDSAGSLLAWSPAGILALMGVAAVATVVGLWPRLKEFL